MHPLGLHIIDLAVVIFFLAGVIGLGWWASRGVHEEKDFYLGGRKLGRTLQFFLSFGNMTDSSGAPTTAAPSPPPTSCSRSISPFFSSASEMSSLTR